MVNYSLVMSLLQPMIATSRIVLLRNYESHVGLLVALKDKTFTNNQFCSMMPPN